MRLVLLLLATALLAKDPDGFDHWSSSELKAYGAKLAPKMNAQKSASQDLAAFGTHWFSVSHREGNGEAEVHEHVADVFVVESGQATLIIGGTVVNGRTTAPGEIRGASIQGGEQHKLAPGDIIHIPANTPHQLLVSKKFTYFVMKVQHDRPCGVTGGVIGGVVLIQDGHSRQ
jgi:mannose-6-phosphate isomerase-like protein (cupin superfamily)